MVRQAHDSQPGCSVTSAAHWLHRKRPSQACRKTSLAVCVDCEEGGSKVKGKAVRGRCSKTNPWQPPALPFALIRSPHSLYSLPSTVASPWGNLCKTLRFGQRRCKVIVQVCKSLRDCW